MTQLYVLTIRARGLTLRNAYFHLPEMEILMTLVTRLKVKRLTNGASLWWMTREFISVARVHGGIVDLVKYLQVNINVGKI